MNYLPEEFSLGEKARFAQNILQPTFEPYHSSGYVESTQFTEYQSPCSWVQQPDFNHLSSKEVGIAISEGASIYCFLRDGDVLVASNLKFGTASQKDKPVSVADIVEVVRSVFGLSVVQISDILRISRPALYNHINGKENPLNLDAYQALYNTAKSTEEKVGKSLKPVLKSVLVDGKTLLGHLKDSYRNTEIIDHVALQAAEKLELMSSRSKLLDIHAQRKATATIGKNG